MAVAVITRLVTFIGTGPISSWNSVPLRTGAPLGAASACGGQWIAETAPAVDAVAPMMKRRRFIDRLPPASSP
jgi:hypothetical protein